MALAAGSVKSQGLSGWGSESAVVVLPRERWWSLTDDVRMSYILHAFKCSPPANDKLRARTLPGQSPRAYSGPLIRSWPEADKTVRPFLLDALAEQGGGEESACHVPWPG